MQKESPSAPCDTLLVVVFSPLPHFIPRDRIIRNLGAARLGRGSGRFPAQYTFICVCVCRVTREQDIIEVYGTYTAEHSNIDDIPCVFFVSNIYSLAQYTHYLWHDIFIVHIEHSATEYIIIIYITKV